MPRTLHFWFSVWQTVDQVGSETPNTTLSSVVVIPSTPEAGCSVAMGCDSDPEHPDEVVVQIPTLPNATSSSVVGCSVTMDCDADPPHPDEIVVQIPILPNKLLDQSMVEYLISLPDDHTSTATVQCLVDGAVLPVSLQQPTAIIPPEEIRPYPVSERVISSASRPKRLSKAKSATLITGSPFKAQLIENQNRPNKNASKRQTTDRGVGLVDKRMGTKKESKPKERKRQNVKNLKERPDGKSNIEENDACVHCGFIYGEPSDPLIDDEWRKCVRCTKWCHLSCGETRKITFSCFKCL